MARTLTRIAIVVAAALMLMSALPAASSAWSWDAWDVSVKDRPGYEVVAFTGWCTRSTTWNIKVTARPRYSDTIYEWNTISMRRSAGTHRMRSRLGSVSSGYYRFRVKIWPTGGRPAVFSRSIFVW